MATSSFEREVIKSGYLTKSPSSGGRGRLKRRWFVLTSSKQDSHPSSGNGACALSSSSFRLDYFEKENHVRKGKGQNKKKHMVHSSFVVLIKCDWLSVVVS